VVSAEYTSRYTVGAYAASPNLFSWDENLELKFYNKLKKLHLIRGLELPFWGESLHPFDDQWLLSNIDPMWENILTCVPGTMEELKKDPYFGLASIDKKARTKALNFYRIAFDCISTLKKNFGEKSVIGITLTSSPCINKKENYGNKDSFFLSMVELSSWDWGNTKIYIEHCDALTKSNPYPQKGFLSLNEEVDVLNQVNYKYKRDINIIINWGRSVIENKSIDGPIKHIKYGKNENILAGVMFSGTTESDDNLYGAWSDLHMPPATHSNYMNFEPDSLMTYENIKNTLKECDIKSLNILGLKVLALPKESSLDKRIGIISDTMDLLEEIISEL